MNTKSCHTFKTNNILLKYLSSYPLFHHGTSLPSPFPSHTCQISSGKWSLKRAAEEKRHYQLLFYRNTAGFYSSGLFTAFICGATTVEHGCAKRLSAPPLSFHNMSCSVGGARSIGTTRSAKSESCSLMVSLLSSLVASTINLRLRFPLFFSEFAEKKCEGSLKN